MKQSRVHVLDCTIRDGSYAIDSQFTVEDTAVLAAGLSSVGISHIEVGHGLGLGGDRQNTFSSATTDVESVLAARQGIQGPSLVGCFFIPSIGTTDDLRAAVDAGLQFIRIGTDIDRYREMQPSIEFARSLGLEVWGNLMKSYIVTPDRFAIAVRDLADMGAQKVALVDSAGGMTPDQVAAYTTASLSLNDTPLGFHGHDNLRLAVANCLRFVECGGQYVDGSLGGIGRSSGNAATELLVALLARKGLTDPDICWESLLEFADEFLNFSVPHRRSTVSSEAAMGLGYIHSGFESIVVQAASAYGTTLSRTVLRLPESASKSVSPEIAQMAALAASNKATCRLLAINSKIPPNRLPTNRNEPQTLEELAKLLVVEKGKWSRTAVVTIVINDNCQDIHLRPLRSTTQTLVAHIEVASDDYLEALYESLDNSVDVWLFDRSIDRGRWIQSSTFRYSYSDQMLSEQACIDTLQAIDASSVLWFGDVAKQSLTARIPHCDLDPIGIGVDAIIITSKVGALSTETLERINDDGYLVLASPGLVSQEFIETARSIGLQVIRVDYGPALLSEAERLIRTHERTACSAGEVQLSDEVRIVAGGRVGNAGDIIVDSINSPRLILGKADGTGGVESLDGIDNADILRVQDWIYRHWVQSLTL